MKRTQALAQFIAESPVFVTVLLGVMVLGAKQFLVDRFGRGGSRFKFS